MGNLITHRAYDPGLDLAVDMSNGGTSVLLSVLVLAGSTLARDDWDRRLVVWLASRDQTIVGVGTVGFDLGHVAWTREDFARQKALFSSLVDLAAARHRWDRLGYEPPFAQQYLARLRTLVDVFAPEHIGAVPPAPNWWWPDDRHEFPRCADDDVILGCFESCLLCNARPR